MKTLVNLFTRDVITKITTVIKNTIFGAPLVLIISNSKMITSITCITTKVCATIPHGLHGSTFLPFGVGNVSSWKIRLECNIWCSTHVCIALCDARIIYVQSTSTNMSKALPLHWSAWSPCVQCYMLWITRHGLLVCYTWGYENTHCGKKLRYSDDNKQTVLSGLPS